MKAYHIRYNPAWLYFFVVASTKNTFDSAKDKKCKGENALLASVVSSLPACVRACDDDTQCAGLEYDQGDVAPYLARCTMKTKCDELAYTDKGVHVTSYAKLHTITSMY